MGADYGIQSFFLSLPVFGKTFQLKIFQPNGRNE